MSESSEEKPSTLETILAQSGISSSLLQKVRFRGPVGKLALVAVLSVLALGGVGVRSANPFVEGLCAVLATVIALAISAGMLWYSHKHPKEATLEGMEVVVMEQQKAWAAKGLPDKTTTTAQLIPEPGAVAPPQELSSGEQEKQ